MSKPVRRGVPVCLSRSQFLIWMGQRLHHGAPLYNMALAFEIHGELDAATFRRAFALLVASSDALRSRIEETAGEPRLATVESEASVETVDLSLAPESVESWMAQRAQRPFDLERCLYDAALVRVGPSRHVWFFNQHHLIADAWSTALCYRRLADFYRSLVDGVAPAVSGFPQLAAYLEHESKARESAANARAEQYWSARVAEPHEPCSFYGNLPARRSARTERVVCALGRERTKRLHDVAVTGEARAITRELSQFHVFAAALYAWMHRVGGGHRDLTFLTPVHNRSTPGFKETIGLFIEVLPLRISLSPGDSYSALLAQIRREYQNLLVNARPGTSSAAQTKAFDVVLNYIPATFGDDFAGMSMRSQWVHPGHGDPAHSLRLQVHDFDARGELVLHFDFHCDVFGSAERQAAVRHFLAILDALLEDSKASIDDVDLLTENERRHRIVAFNQASREFPDRTVLDAIDRHVADTPEAIAVRDGEVAVSYAELDARANRLARDLIDGGATAGTTVALCLERSPRFLVAILAVLRAGAAYVPIEPSFPRGRIELLLAESSASHVVTDAGASQRLPAETAASVVCFDRDAARIDGRSAAPLGVEVAPSDRAYVIYTSGSTGRPKGVSISHRALANYISWAREQYTRGPTDFAFFSPVAVDLTVTSVFVPLASGGSIAVYPREDAEHDLAVLRVFAEDDVDVVKLTPAHLSLLLAQGRLAATRISTLIVGGEDFPRKLAQRVQDQLGDRVAIYNEYGPTEATVGCMIHRFRDEHEAGASVAIGRPIANARIYLLDERMRPVPAGVPGEIWIGGVGVADGYFGDAEQTARRFVTDPFAGAPARMYRSGDLGREDPSSGDLVFGGRIDDQVKIRGARIELAEVQACLEAHDRVRASFVDVAVREPKSTVAPAEAWSDVRYCVRCGLASNHPDAHLDAAGVCAVCEEYEGYRDQAQSYFRSMGDLQQLLQEARVQRGGGQDCLMLLSGGKDSTYALYQLVEMGATPLVFSLDNGYISESAKDNIRRVVDDLGLELVFATTPSMNAIFADSLQRFCNVCQGCFKTIYTLSMKLAHERGIRHIVTGLSRGQIFETRLADCFRNGIFEADEVDRVIIEARKAYHRVDDAVARQLDVSMFANDDVFEEIRFVDFYRYCDAPLSEVLRFIKDRAAWVRPEDTGRSTNCLINDTGIFVHKERRGYHNYALPYSWDVRLGHKTRAECLDELDDEIDEARVRRTLQEVGAAFDDEPEGQDRRLVAYYVADAEAPTSSELRGHVADRLPAYMVPSAFVRVDRIPLTAHGKVDRAALPAAEAEAAGTDARSAVAPRSEIEQVFHRIWREVLGVDSFGIHDDFLELGGDSILSIQIVSRARTAGYRIEPKHVFAHPTVADLAAVAVEVADAAVDRAPVTGAVELTPIQRWFFDLGLTRPHHCGQSYVLETTQRLDGDALELAFRAVLVHHDALRCRFVDLQGAPLQQIADPVTSESFSLERHQLAHESEDALTQRLREVELDLHERVDLTSGRLLEAALLQRTGGHGCDLLVVVVHHLAIDAVSWEPLLADLEAAYSALARGAQPELPSKTLSWQAWAAAMHRVDVSAETASAWSDPAPVDLRSIPVDVVRVDAAEDRAPGARSTARLVTNSLTVSETDALAETVQGNSELRVQELLLAAFVHHAARAAGDSKRLRVDLEGHGRDHPDLGELDTARTVGWFTTMYPLDLTAGSDAQSTLRNVRDALAQVVDGGHGFGLLRYGDGSDPRTAAFATRPRSEVLFNYIGRSGAFLAGSQLFRCWRPLEMSWSPNDDRTHLLEVFGSIEAGQLVLRLGYSEQRHRRETIEALANAILETVRAFVQTGVDASPADFPNADLSQGELDGIMKEFGGE